MSTTFCTTSNNDETADDDELERQQHQQPLQSPAEPIHSSEWDSDIDDSSEEFEYVKGADHRNTATTLANRNGDAATEHAENGASKAARQPDSLGTIGEEEVWNAHADMIPVATTTTKGV